MTNALGGYTQPDLPSFQNVDLTPGEESTGAAIANRYTQLGLGDSTMLTQDESANAQKWQTNQALLNNQFAQQNFQNQLALNQQNQGSLTGLASLLGFTGAA